MTGGLNVFLQVKCFFYKSDYGSRRASQYRITTHLGVRVNVKEIGMTDKKEAVLLKINQINVELDSLIDSYCRDCHFPKLWFRKGGHVSATFSNNFQHAR